MTDKPAPLVVADVKYYQRTPFGLESPKQTYVDVQYENGHILADGAGQSLFQNCTFKGVVFKNLFSCMFEECKFEDCLWEDQVLNVHFKNCDLRKNDFTVSSLSRVVFYNCKVRDAYFSQDTTFEGVELRGVEGLETAWALHDVHVEQGKSHPLQTALDGYIERLELPWHAKWLSWVRLREFGKLPLFGVSYTGLVSIPAFMFLLSAYNAQVERLQGLALDNSAAAALVAGRLQIVPVPSLSLSLLLGLVMLAVASTIYAIRCPPRVRSFSYETWVDELRRPAIHYLPLGWRDAWARLACGILYPAGAALTLFVLIMKLWQAGRYILEHSPISWLRW